MNICGIMVLFTHKKLGGFAAYGHLLSNDAKARLLP